MPSSKPDLLLFLLSLLFLLFLNSRYDGKVGLVFSIVIVAVVVIYINVMAWMSVTE